MPLYEDGKYHALFIGNMHPVKLMDGNKVVFEPNVSELSGEVLSVNKTYNDSAFVRINGNTQEIGEGEKSPDNPYELKSVGDDGGFDVVSAGKNLFIDDLMLNSSNYEYISPYHYYEIFGLKPDTNYTFGLRSDFNLDSIARPSTGNRAIRINNSKTNPATNVVNVISTGAVSTPRTIKSNSAGILYLVVYQPQILESLTNGLQLEEGGSRTTYEKFKGTRISFPYTLRSLPDGTSDYIKIDNAAKTAKLVRNVGVKVFSGSDIFNPYSNHTNTISRSIVISDAKGLSYNNDETRSDRLTRISNVSSDMEGYGNGDATNRLFIRLNKSRLAGYEESWTSPQISTAVNHFFEANNWILQYKLAIPTITSLDYETYKVLTYYPYTQIYTTATVQPTLDGKFRVWGS